MFFTKYHKKKLERVKKEVKQIDEDIDKIISRFNDKGLGDISRNKDWGYRLRFTREVNLHKMSEKIDLILDHLGLEYKPAEECEPKLVEKEEG